MELHGPVICLCCTAALQGRRVPLQTGLQRRQARLNQVTQTAIALGSADCNAGQDPDATPPAIRGPLWLARALLDPAIRFLGANDES